MLKPIERLTREICRLFHFVSMMKIGLITFAAVLFSVSTNAQLLWKITGNGLSKPSYLLGSMHYAPAHFIDSIQGLRAVMAEVEQCYGETVDSDTTVNYFTPDDSVLEMPEDSVMSDFYTKEEQNRINHFIFRLTVFEEDDFLGEYEDDTPGAVFHDLVREHVYEDNAKFVFGSIPQITFDTNFEIDAIKNNKPVGALDDSELHRSVISDDLYLGRHALKMQAKSLLFFIDNYATLSHSIYRSMVEYRSQDLLRINNTRSIKQRNKGYRKEKNTSCQGRNITWAKKMPAIMADKSTLFVVGVAHLGHPKEKRGLLQLLQKAGYTLEPVSQPTQN